MARSHWVSQVLSTLTIIIGGGRPRVKSGWYNAFLMLMQVHAARHVQEVVAGLVSLVFPPHCLLCRTPLEVVGLDEALCAACGAALPVHPLPAIAPPDLVWVRAACRYEGAAKHCVLRLKYDAQLGLVEPMARRMLAAAGAAPTWAADAVLPVPLHAVRARERTFNHAEQLAAVVGRGLGVPALTGTLVRTRPTTPQHRLDARSRRRNVAGAFTVRRPEWVRGRRLLLVDDVLTTGATARACARALTADGAAEIGLLTFARD